MAVASKTWTVGEVVTAANMNTYVRDNLSDLQTNKAVIKSGTYTGNGSTGQAITGVGFEALWLFITTSPTDGANGTFFYTTDLYNDTDADGIAVRVTQAPTITGVDKTIISIGADGFTVGDDGTDAHPNKNGATYFYIAIGQE